MPDGVDKQLGKYTLKSQIGKGGMGVVYLATDERLKRDVALKILPRQVSANAEAVERFFQEARVLARLNHPHVVVIHDVGQDRGYCYLVMELLKGGTFGDILKRGPLAWPEATDVIAQACRGLAAAQNAGLIHRDIKPSNLMRTADGCVKLTDFGLVKVTDDAGGKRLTKTGAVMGTPEYMSPEQCRGEVLDARSDVYSLGVTYFALLTGDPPFPADEAIQVMFAHCSKPPPDLLALRPDIPSACADIVKKALAKSRGDRYRTAQEMLEALTQLLNAAPTLAQKQMPPHIGVESRDEDLTATVNLRLAPEGTLATGRDATQPIARRSWRWPLNRNRTLLAAAGCLLLLVLLAWISRPRPTPLAPIAPVPIAKEKAPPLGPIHLEPAGELPIRDMMVRGAAFTEDGKSLFVGGSDGNIHQWDLGEKKILRKLTGAKTTVHALAASPQWLAAGGQARTLWLWRIDAAQPHEALELRGEISALAFSPDGRKLAVGTYNEARLYDVNEDGLRLQKVLGTSAAPPACYMVMGVAFSSDSRSLATTTWTDKRAILWDTSTGALRGTSPSQINDPMTVAFLPGQEKVLMGIQRHGLLSWVPGDKTTTPLRASAHCETRVVVVPDEKTAIVIGEWGGIIRLFDLVADLETQVLPGTTNTGTVTATLSKDGKVFAVGGGSEDGPKRGYLQLWKVARGKIE